ncbi:cephalosporin hydroxylase family protein [Paenibacillus sp. L3-i20]|uniref:cephalosporin hydroxylase family protein n=1 Tax=Paenibacillus sp. L3-i20 TaxID=2905833 RepID=UPI001EDD3E06|nr:cephalosporin hydroxylase family protein [Paenibacillus sp. L3-i20]GKU76795.1 cephalosporin hydroxylase [Paenibacillus sp. L3-i20]
MDKAAFELEKIQNIQALGNNETLKKTAHDFILQQVEHKYTYNFTWLGIPIIQFPQDMIALQEVIWKVKPDVIIETGIARGGSAIFYASLQKLIGNDGIVIGVDVDIRPHNRVEIENHPLSKNIYLIEGDSVSQEVYKQVVNIVSNRKSVLIILDSNHTHEHVYKELEVYSPLVSENSYLIVLDTVVDDMPDHFFEDRPWKSGNSPKSAVRQFLKHNQQFVVDKSIEDKLLITVAPEGYLKRLPNE